MHLSPPPISSRTESTLRVLGVAGWASLITVCGVGTFWAFQRGGADFRVFYMAGYLVAHGGAAQIYHATPDRFLYAPGFAWLLAPLGFFAWPSILALWCAGKTLILIGMVHSFQKKLTPHLPSGILAWGVMIYARPLLIDFQYGQVNSLILGSCCWALGIHFSGAHRGAKNQLHPLLAWTVLGMMAVTKLFALPLLLVPFLVSIKKNTNERRTLLRAERWGSLLGILLALALPVLTIGWTGTWNLLAEWLEALRGRGLPLESHNQSFMAFLHHYFSGEPTHIISMGTSLNNGWALLSPLAIQLLSLGWSLTFIATLLAWMIRSRQVFEDVEENRQFQSLGIDWTSIACALLFLPSHLIWKPYFVFGIPLGMSIVSRLVETRANLILVMTLFVLINFTGFDFVGSRVAAKLESASVFLLAHVLLLVLFAHLAYSKRGGLAVRQAPTLPGA